MKRKHTWNLKDELHEMSKLLEEPARIDVLSERPRREIIRELDKPSKELRRRTAPLITYLSILSGWEATAGAVAVLNGNSAGWSKLQLGFFYETWSIRCRHAIRDAEKDPKKLRIDSALFDDHEAHCLAEAIATGGAGVAHGMGQKLIANFRAFGSGDAFFYGVPFQPFMLKLYTLWVGKEVTFRDDVADPLGDYQPVVDAWGESDGFAEALLGACDYHCRHCFDEPGHPAEFIWYPYNVFPVEILAIQRIRRDLGLSAPKIEHPLLDSPLVDIPTTLPVVHDELLERIKERARADFPEIGDPW